MTFDVLIFALCEIITDLRLYYYIPLLLELRFLQYTVSNYTFQDRPPMIYNWESYFLALTQDNEQLKNKIVGVSSCLMCSSFIWQGLRIKKVWEIINAPNHESWNVKVWMVFTFPCSISMWILIFQNLSPQKIILKGDHL